MEFEKTASRIWRHLSKEERLEAAEAFFVEPSAEVLASALALIVKTRHLRPQFARSLPASTKAEMLASTLDPGDAVAGALLVGLHLAKRRELLAKFLDGAGVKHENGLIAEDESGGPLPDKALRAGLDAVKSFPLSQVNLYLNVLWLQDPERWAKLPEVRS